jgi:hypothetical protein
MKGLKNTTVWDFLNTIQTKAKANVTKINQNNIKIEDFIGLKRNNILDTEDLIAKLRSENKDLIEENTLLLNLHQKILAFGGELKISEDKPQINNQSKTINKGNTSQDVSQHTAEEYVGWVIDKFIRVDEDHPCFSDEKIIDKIYNALIKLERYEECSILLKRKDQLRINK